MQLSTRHTMWAIEAPKRRRRHILDETISDTKKDAKRKMEELFKEPWEVIESYGWKCIKISIEAISVW